MIDTINNINSLIFVDSNIWLYCFLTDQDPDPVEDARKRSIANSITDGKSVVVSTQTINEVCSILKRQLAFNETEILSLIESFERHCMVVQLKLSSLKKASELRQQYYFSFWDSLIVASALEANVSILYSEDMQNGLIVSDMLTIVNPFQAN